MNLNDKVGGDAFGQMVGMLMKVCAKKGFGRTVGIKASSKFSKGMRDFSATFTSPLDVRDFKVAFCAVPFFGKEGEELLALKAKMGILGQQFFAKDAARWIENVK